MEIILFLVVIAVGLGLFAFIFLKELKSGAFDGNTPPEPSFFKTAPVVEKKSPVKSKAELPQKPPEDDTAKPAELLSGGILNERAAKLDQLLEEKNRHTAQLEKELAAERAHRGDFDSLKDILQRQIEDLKAQNKTLKDDLAKALQGNVQTEYKAPPALDNWMVPEPPKKSDQFLADKKPADKPGSLFDVFEKNQDKPV